jgi:hypothetical protein
MFHRYFFLVVFIPHEDYTPHNLYTPPRGGGGGGGVDRPGWGVRGKVSPQRGFKGEAPEGKISL